MLQKSGICPSKTFAKLVANLDRLPDEPTKLAAVLIRDNVLTKFQAKLLLAGRHRGFKLGSYLIRDRIGQGGTGTVYLAQHLSLRRLVALKVLAVTEITNRVAIERFSREARAAAALDHPNIVHIFDVGQQGTVHFLAMEYIDGQTLDHLVTTTGPLPWPRAVAYVLDAAAGLQHAHEKGFIHRDIKPSNLILADDGTVKILDMGLARSFEPADKLTELLDKGAVLGTADYIAPEQAMNHPDLDIRADIYSLGATLFALVTGRPPFQGSTAQKLIQHQMNAAPAIGVLVKAFPPGLAKIVAKMLAKKPADRYRTPAEVIAALKPWLSGTQTELTAAAEIDQQSSNDGVDDDAGPHEVETRRSKWPFIIAGAILLAIALAAFAIGVVASGMLDRIP